MSERKTVLWMAFVVPPVRSVVRTSVALGYRASQSVLRGLLRVERGAERRLMDPGPPRSWEGAGSDRRCAASTTS